MTVIMYGPHHSHYQLNYCKPFSIGHNADIHVIVKIESADSIPNLHSILSASDGVSFITFRSCICRYFIPSITFS